jgi:hypothetical protein
VDDKELYQALLQAYQPFIPSGAVDPAYRQRARGLAKLWTAAAEQERTRTESDGGPQWAYLAARLLADRYEQEAATGAGRW